jgi:hypothetical protein
MAQTTVPSISATAKAPRAAGVDERRDQGMADGGAIEIRSNEPTDAAGHETVRKDLAMIAVMFSQGDFAIPMFIHATVPPGVEGPEPNRQRTCHAGRLGRTRPLVLEFCAIFYSKYYT